MEKISGIGEYTHWSKELPELIQPEYNPTFEQIKHFMITGVSTDGTFVPLNAYGMGGCGYLRMDLENKKSLVICLWGAYNGGWISLDGKPMLNDDAKTLVGKRVMAYTCNEKSLSMTLSDLFTTELVIDENPTKRPVWQGSKKPRIIDGDLRKGVIYFDSKYIVYS